MPTILASNAVPNLILDFGGHEFQTSYGDFAPLHAGEVVRVEDHYLIVRPEGRHGRGLVAVPMDTTPYTILG